MGLLDDLKKQADQVRTHENLKQSVRGENLAAVEAAMGRTFQYFHDLLKQLAVIKPVSPLAFSVPGVGEFVNMVFADGSIDYRKKKINDTDYYDHLELYVNWTKPESLVLERDMPATIKKASDLLWSVNLKFTEEVIKNAAGSLVKTRFVVPSKIRADVAIHVDYENRRLLIYGKNLLRLGPDDFAVPADEISEAVLEDFAKLLIGQPSAFRRFRTVLPRR